MTSDEYADRFEDILHAARDEWLAERRDMARAICALVDAYDDEEERNVVLCTLPLDVHVMVMRARSIDEERA